MAELLIRIRDKVNQDSIYLDCSCLKRGDVVTVQRDGWPWGDKELSNPDWRILAVPGTSVNVFQALLAEEVDENPSMPSRVLQRRGFGLHLNSNFITARPALVNWLTDDTRAIPILTFNLTQNQIDALRIKKPRLVDPNEFRPASNPDVFE